MEPSQIIVIKTLIAKSNTEDAVVEFKKVIIGENPQYEGTLIMMESEIENLKNEYLGGLIESAEYRRERLKISHRVLELVNTIAKDLDDKELKLRKAKKIITDPINRQEMLGYFSKELCDQGEYGVVRQKAAFSTFAIPNREPTDSIWKERDGDQLRDINHYVHSWSERKWLEAHAINTYCKLIIKPSIAIEIAESRGRKAAIMRLKCLQDFLESNKEKVDIVTTDNLGENIIIVGNWFISQSSKPTDKGYEDTLFEWEKSIVEAKAKDFDLQFQSILEAKGIDVYQSKYEALEQIQTLIKEI